MTNTISTAAFYDGARANLASLQNQATALQTSISTGNKYASASENPAAAAQLRVLQAADTLSAADTANAQAAKTNLTQTDDTLSQVTAVVTQIQTLATQAASGTLNDTQRADIGAQVSVLHDQLVALANTTNAGGHALFGGQTGAGAAYAVDASGNASYVGSAASGLVSLGPGLSVTTGIVGPDFLNFKAGGVSTDLLAATKALADGLQGKTAGVTAQAAAAGALDTLTSGLSAVTAAQTVVGARLAWVTTSTNIQTQLAQQRTTSEADIGGTDIASAVSRLQQTMTALQASQASFVKLSGLSLFTYIQ